MYICTFQLRECNQLLYLILIDHKKHIVLKYKESLNVPKGGNHNPYIEEGQTTQWPKEKGQKDKQLSTTHTHKTKDRVTQTPL